jgi:DNA modification methylase
MGEGVSWKVLLGDNRETIKKIEDNTVQTVITSPPYFGLRRYGDSNDEIGIEETPEAYISNLCNVFDEIHPKLKDDGTLFVNLGDTYSSNVSEGIKKFGSKNFQEERPGRQNVKQPGRKITGDLKPKDLIGIPWMFAFEMRRRGWYLRQDIIWDKPNPMPESVEDRCTKSHEYIFLLTKSPDYYFDFKSITEKSETPLKEKKKTIKINNFSFDDLENFSNVVVDDIEGKLKETVWEPDGTRRKRSVWSVPASCGEAIGIQHFATYPVKLVDPCVKAGSKVNDIILDPFNGSGTTGVVAMEQGRHYIGCELNQEFEKIYTIRLSEAQRGYNLSQGLIDNN